MATIPNDFLRGPPPQNASTHQIDFANSPIPGFKGRFAAVIDNLFSEAECSELLRLAEHSTHSNSDSDSDSPAWQRAMINMGNGKQAMSVDTRKSGRIILDSPDLAGRLLDRLMPYMREWKLDTVHDMPQVTGLGPAKRGERFQISRLNERLRFLRYEGGDYFRPHWDGCFVTPDGRERSLFTIHLYLNGEGEQDMNELMGAIKWATKNEGVVGDGEDYEIDFGGDDNDDCDDDDGGDKTAPVDSSQDSLLGGATSFTDSLRADEAVRVFPKTGSVLVFQQRNLMHSGDDVFRGVKYTMRSDVMYTMDGGESE